MFIGASCIQRRAGSISDLTPPHTHRQSMDGHAIDIVQECILVPKIITDVIQAQWSVS